VIELVDPVCGPEENSLVVIIVAQTNPAQQKTLPAATGYSGHRHFSRHEKKKKRREKKSRT